MTKLIIRSRRGRDENSEQQQHKSRAFPCLKYTTTHEDMAESTCFPPHQVVLCSLLVSLILFYTPKFMLILPSVFFQSLMASHFPFPLLFFASVAPCWSALGKSFRRFSRSIHGSSCVATCEGCIAAQHRTVRSCNDAVHSSNLSIHSLGFVFILALRS